MCFNEAMNYETPSLFDDENGNENKRPATPPRTSEQRTADLKQIIEQQKQEQERSAAYLNERARQDQDRIDRAAEAGVDLHSKADIQRDINRRGLEKAQETLDQAKPPEIL